MPFMVKDILRINVKPSLGCTEPAAIALSAASAAFLLKEKCTDIEVWVDANIYKNGMAVSIPGAGGLCGLNLASALGALGGNPDLKMEVLDTVTDAHITQANEMIRNDKVKINLLQNHKGLYIKTIIKGESQIAESETADYHDNIISLKLNGQEITSSLLLSSKNTNNWSELKEIEEWLKKLSFEQLLAFLDDLDEEDLQFLEEGIQLNLCLAEYGIKHGSGLGIGKTMDRLTRQRLLKKDMILSARILTSAASDARMAGVKLPAMSSAGSGNHGLTATLPIWALKDYVDCEKKTFLEAVALSHIITAYIKAYTGRLSALCGCSVAAGAGAAAGICYLLGGTQQQIAGAIKNLAEDLAGIICDGAKASCSLKLSTAAGSAVQAALFSLQGIQVHCSDGIIASSPVKTMQNIGTLSTQGMLEADRTILQIMMDKEFTG